MYFIDKHGLIGWCAEFEKIRPVNNKGKFRERLKKTCFEKTHLKLKHPNWKRKTKFAFSVISLVSLSWHHILSLFQGEIISFSTICNTWGEYSLAMEISQPKSWYFQSKIIRSNHKWSSFMVKMDTKSHSVNSHYVFFSNKKGHSF